MPAEVFVRAFRPSDMTQLRWLHDRTPPAGEVATQPQKWPEALTDIETNFEAFWVAIEATETGNALVGMAGICLPGSAAEMVEVPDFIRLTSHCLSVDYVRVAPERQRRGIGRLLTETCIAWARANGYDRLLLNTTPQQKAAVALYEALGFRDVGRSMIGHYELIWFQLRL